MFRDIAFLRDQIAQAVAQHQTFLDRLIERQSGAADARVRALSTQYVEPMRQHQQMLLQQLQAVAGRPATPTVPPASPADRAPVADYAALGGDLAASQRVEEHFRVFREAGGLLGEDRLATIGASCEETHAQYAAAARQLLTALFVGHGRGDAAADLSVDEQLTATVDDHPALADTATIRIRASDTVGPIGPEGPEASYGSVFEQERNEARDT